MGRVKVAITLDRETLVRVDGLVSKSISPIAVARLKRP